MDFDVFLSHNGRDKPAVEQIAHMLTQKYGLRCWLDKWNLVPGEPWQEALEDALDQCRTVAVFVGSNTISPWENEEMRTALATRVQEKKRRVIPVLLPGAPDSKNLQLPRFLSRLTWVDFRSGLDDENALYRLYCGIQGIKPGADAHTAGAGTMGLPVSPKAITLFLRFLRKRYIWMPAIGVIALVLLILSLTGNLFFDVPFLCGKKYSSAAGYINQAIKQRDAGKSNCAIQNLQGGLETNHSLVEKQHIYYLFATVYLNRQDALEALDYADAGLKLNTGDEYNHLLHASRGFAYCQLKQNTQASVEFNVFLELKPAGVGSLANTVTSIVSDLDSGTDMAEVCWVEGATSLP